MRLVRLEPGQLWQLTWYDTVQKTIIDVRRQLILLLRWDAKETQWWVYRCKESSPGWRKYPSASFWNEEIIDLDQLPSSYSLERIA